MTVEVGERVLVAKRNFPAREAKVTGVRDLPASEKWYWALAAAEVQFEDGSKGEALVTPPWLVPEHSSSFGLLVLRVSSPPSEQTLAQLGKWRDRFYIAAGPEPPRRPQLICKKCLCPVSHSEVSTEVADFYVTAEEGWYVAKPELVSTEVRLRCWCHDVDLEGLFTYWDHHGGEHEAWRTPECP